MESQIRSMLKYPLVALLSFVLIASTVQAKLLADVTESDLGAGIDLNFYRPIFLRQGWNLIAYPLNDEIDVAKVKSECATDFLQYSGDPNNPWNAPTKLQPGKAYYAYADNDCLLDFYGEPASFTKLSLKKGWNLITPPTFTSFNKVLGKCKGKVDDEKNVLGLDENTGQFVQKRLLEPTKGYWIFVGKDCELDFSKAEVDVVTPGPGTTEKKSFFSNALGRQMEYSVYLPPTYSEGRRYPVVYILMTGGEWKSLDNGVGDKIKDMTSKGEIQEMIFVAPDIKNSALENGCSGWSVNPKEIGTAFKLKTDDRCGNYEDYIVKDLIPHIDSTYRTIPTASSRGIIGFANGGTGAMSIAFNYPKMFSFVASHAANFKEGVGKAFSAYTYGLKIPSKEEVDHMTIRIVAPYTCLASCPTALQLSMKLNGKGIKHQYIKKFTWIQGIPVVDILATEIVGFWSKTYPDSIIAASEVLTDTNQTSLVN